MGSTRLPGKVMADICGTPALSRQIRRVKRSHEIENIVLATTTNSDDDALIELAANEGISYFRGSEEDVLGRVIGAHEQIGSDIIVQLTGDCPLLDAELIDMAINTYLENDCDVVTSGRRPTYPTGIMDVQVFSYDSLLQVFRTIDDPIVREHVSIYFHEHLECYQVMNLVAPRRWTGPSYRLQLDYPEDLRLLRELYSRLEPVHGEFFGVDEVMNLLREEPDLLKINSHCKEKSIR
jgi:spore coat polysaccharide biosynthesis protein SpsF